MGKTVRNAPHWAKVRDDEDLSRFDHRTRTRLERFNRKIIQKRDGVFVTELGASDVNTPKGYNTWDKVWGMHRKRSEKALTHRMTRRTAVVDLTPYQE